MIDIHTHILPDLDDGPDNIEESLALARAAFEAGTKMLVATPHVLNGLDMNQSMQIVKRFNQFKARLKQDLPELELMLGSEIYFRPDLAGIAHLDVATIGAKGRYMLVEFSLVDIPKGFDRELKNIRSSGIVPIIAHPERNAAAIKRPALVRQMMDCGALIQMNAGSLTGSFGRTVRNMARNLLKRGWVHVIASDSHGINHRGPGLQAAVSAAAEIIGAANARRLVVENPRIIVEGLPWTDNKV